VDRALNEFLAADEPRAIALTGEWGRGKSYYWRSFLSSRRFDPEVTRSYAYVSLFGLSKLDDVRDALVANAVPIGDVSQKAPPSASRSFLGIGRTRAAKLGSDAERLARSYSDLIAKAPKIGQLGGLAMAMAFRLVS